MTVSSANNRDDYTGNGTTANYAYTFRVYAKTDINVYVVETATGAETTLVVDTDYRVNNIGATTGTIDLLDAGQAWIDGSSFLDTGYTLAIIRSLPYTQPSEFRNQGTFYPEAHEDAIDRVAMLTQQLNEEDSRTIAFSEATNIGSFDTSLPSALATSGAGKLIVVNDAGDGFDVGPTAGNIAAAEANATAAAASAAAASTSETNAAASETAAADAVASSGWTEVSLKTFTNNNTYILNTEMGTCFLIDASSGATNLYLPLIGTIDQTLPHSIMVKRNPIDSSGNAITITTSGVDKINDASTTVVTLPTTQGNWAVEFIGNNVYSPDRWQTVVSGSGAWNEQASTKGDLLSFSTGPAKLAVGTDGYSLEADSSESTGIKWGFGIAQQLQCQAYLNFNSLPVTSIGTTYAWSRAAVDPSNGLIFVVGDGNVAAVMRSTSYGQTFSTPFNLAASATFKDFIYSASASLYLALESTGTSAIQSATGTGVWTSRTTPNKSWQALCDTGSLIVAISSDGASGNGAMYSTNGTSWTQSTACQDSAFKAIATDGTTIVAVGDSGVVSTTTDGDTWTSRTAAWGSTNWSTIVWDSRIGQFLANGSGTTGEEFMTSTDGITWTAGSTENQTFTQLGHDGDIYYAHTSGTHYTSVDGVTWYRSITPSNSGSIQDFVFVEGRVVSFNSNSSTDRCLLSDAGVAGVRV